MISYHFHGMELELKKEMYNDGHTAIFILKDGKYYDKLTTNFSKELLGRELSETEIFICMTSDRKHHFIRELGLALEEDGILKGMADFIRTYNEYFRYVIPDKTMKMLESEEIIEFVPEVFEPVS